MYIIENQTYLYLLFLVPAILLVYAFYMFWKMRMFRRLGDIHLLKKLTKGFSKSRFWFKAFLFVLAIALIIVGLANPQSGSKMELAERKGIDIVIALDISNSMLAEDLQPNRLERAKQSILKLIDKLANDRIGVIVFAGKAYTQLPITTDYSAAKMFVSTISTDMIPVQGTAISNAIDMASESFQDEKHSKAIIIITDGENHEGNVLESAKAASEKGIYIFTIGMGKAQGVPIPIYRGNRKIGYRKDAEGNTVISKLDENMLRKIAATGNGTYINANNTSIGLQHILKELGQLEKTKMESKMFTDYEDKFQLFLLIGLALLVIEFLIFERKSSSLLNKIIKTRNEINNVIAKE